MCEFVFVRTWIIPKRKMCRVCWIHRRKNTEPSKFRITGGYAIEKRPLLSRCCVKSQADISIGYWSKRGLQSWRWQIFFPSCIRRLIWLILFILVCTWAWFWTLSGLIGSKYVKAIYVYNFTVTYATRQSHLFLSLRSVGSWSDRIALTPDLQWLILS